MKWPNAANLPHLWNENREGILRYIEQALLGIHLNVVDSSGKTLKQVTVRTISNGRTSGIDRIIHYASGFVHRPSVSQLQTLEISSPGYRSETLNFSPWVFSGSNYRELTLNQN